MSEVNPADKILDGNPKVKSFGIDYPQMFGDINLLHKDCSNILKDSTDSAVIVDLSTELLKIQKEQGTEAQPSNQQTSIGFSNQGVPPPVDIGFIRKLKDISPHHASCIQSKKYSILGLGFISDAGEVEDSKKTTPTDVKGTENKVTSLLTGESFIESKVDTMLGPLTLHGFMDVLYKSIEDFLDGGTGYLEINRNADGVIVGINWLPYEDIRVVHIKDVDGKNRYIYRYMGNAFGAVGTRFYSLFGKENKQWVWDTFYAEDAGEQDILDDAGNKVAGDPLTNGALNITQISEVIPFTVPSNRCKYYGYPEWLSASSLVALVAMAVQHKSDFYTNRGVLAYILSVLGPMPDDKFKELADNVQGSVGGGNNFKSIAINIDDPKGKVQVDKLASSDKTEKQFSLDMEVVAQNIVSAHRVPPVLANILIPGKLGATNEAVQALVSFQLLVVGPYQTIIQKTLARTLGSESDGVKGLSPEDFRLRTITSQFDITGLDTVGRAKEEATGSDRDFSEGVKD